MPTETEVSPQDAMKSFQAGLGPLMAEIPKPETAASAAALQVKSDAPKPEAPKLEAQPATTEEKIPRTSQEWKKFTAKRDADIAERDKQISDFKAKTAELETKLKAGVSTPELDTLKADLDKIKKERDEYDERLKVVAVTNHPTFIREFETKLNSQIELAKKLVEKDQHEAWERVLSMQDGKFRDAKIEELMEPLTPVQVARMGSILNSIFEINTLKQEIIKNAGEEHAKMTAAQQEQSKKRAESMEAALKESLAKAPEHILYKKTEDVEWNKDVDARLKQAETLARSSLSVADSTKIVLDHLALPVIQKQLESSRAEIEKLKGQIADFTGANPGISSRTPEPGLDEGGGQPVRIQSGSNPMEAAKSWIKSLGRLG